MNFNSISAIYSFEVARAWRTIGQTIAAPVVSTCLYFIVFGTAIGSRMGSIDGVSYAAFIIPGLVMMSLLTQSISNASFGIFFPRFSGTIFEVLSAPISYFEILLGYVGAAASKSLIVGLLILITARLFVDYNIQHPFWMITFLILTAVTFSLFGFILGIVANGFDQLQVVPLMIITPLAFLGGTFYSIDMLPPFWQTVTLFNPVVYLVSGFRWSFYGISDVSILTSVSMISLFLVGCVVIVWRIFATGYRLKD
jgi:ABC-2 type transport system permease protein